MSGKRVIKIEAGKTHPAYGDEVTLDVDGTLSINMYDGYTRLSKREALELAEVLTAWAVQRKSSPA